MPTCSCNDWSRSRLLRSAAAQAGQGLPAIEAGMPIPAGTGLTRRSFVSRTAGLALAVYGAAGLGPKALEEGIAAAQAAEPSQRVLVSIYLSGGADSLSILAPTEDTRYQQLRPNLRVQPGQGTPFSEDPSLRWHPSAGGLASLHNQGKLTVMPAVGYSDANQSHFTSRHFWEVGDTNPGGRWGWLGRFLDRTGNATNPLQGLTIGWDLNPTLAAQNVPVATVSRPDDYEFVSPDVWNTVSEPMMDTFGELGNLATSDPGLAYARGAVAATGRLRDQLAPFQNGFTLPGDYPAGDFGRRLGALAAMLSAGLPLRIVAVEADGSYDTHSNQAADLAERLGNASAALLAFQSDLERRGLSDRVLVHVWSEFGRRPAENGSGTDHGAAGIGFVMGEHATGQMVGEFPGLASSQLDEDENLRANVDFRAVYSSLLEQWLAVGADGIIPRASTVGRVPLVA
ncbi:MAG: DUF1501 domain-containing protein [Thermoleophilaceae bacterium]|nr:DUF1501 domain-containing protein [Thermoleophilaceae bacterium]